jgi:RNA-binding protein
MSKKANLDNKQLRSIGHKLKPVVTIAGKGLTENVLAEVDRALTDHELIKVRLSVGSRTTREEIAQALSTQAKAELVQSIGNVVLLLRRSANPDPRLSNLIKPI